MPACHPTFSFNYRLRLGVASRLVLLKISERFNVLCAVSWWATFLIRSPMAECLKNRTMSDSHKKTFQNLLILDRAASQRLRLQLCGVFSFYQTSLLEVLDIRVGCCGSETIANRFSRKFKIVQNDVENTCFDLVVYASSATQDSMKASNGPER